MDPYLRQYNNFINLTKILILMGKCMTNLPNLPQYCLPTGATIICWNSVLGKCLWGKRCKFARGHVKKGDATKAFADEVVDVISKGVVPYINLPARGSLPHRKCKTVESSSES